MGHRAWATSDEYFANIPHEALPSRTVPLSGRDDARVVDGTERPEQAKEPVFEQRLEFPTEPHAERPGRRRSSPTDRPRGRYARSRLPTGNGDYALDATLRAAAERRVHNARICVEVCDLREKVRTERVGRLLVFVLDLSGSMGDALLALARRAAGQLLEEAYLRRDRVGLVAFRGTEAEVVFAPTSSVEHARRRLATLPSGGKTPLAFGLRSGLEMLRRGARRRRDADPVLVVITDGQANVGSRPGYAAIREEVDRVSAALAEQSRLRTVVFDATEDGKNDFHADRLATALGARRLKVHRLRDLDDARLRALLRNV